MYYRIDAGSTNAVQGLRLHSGIFGFDGYCADNLLWEEEQGKERWVGLTWEIVGLEIKQEIRARDRLKVQLE